MKKIIITLSLACLFACTDKEGLATSGQIAGHCEDGSIVYGDNQCPPLNAPSNSSTAPAQPTEGSTASVQVTEGSMTDSRDGQSYRTVTIGEQTWMAENLNYEAVETYCYGDNAGNCATYGGLYGWAAAKEACPEGWHLPTQQEWNTLFAAVGGQSTAGHVLKAATGWNCDGNGTDAYGFSALPAGARVYSYESGWASYSNIGNYAFFWSATEGSSYCAEGSSWCAYAVALDCTRDSAFWNDAEYGMGNALSVRCLRDASWSAPSSSSTAPTQATEGSMTDSRDGQSYRTVIIGEQTWMAENLNYGTVDSYCYGDNAGNCATYGRLYTWATAMSVCPEGWRLPTQQEWDILFAAVGGQLTAGRFLPAATGWNCDGSGGNGSGTDAYGFSALPVGHRTDGGVFVGESTSTYFWSATEDSSDNAYLVYLNVSYDDSHWNDNTCINAGKSSISKIDALSVRCLRDSSTFF